jgi:hypothetical protein
VATQNKTKNKPTTINKNTPEDSGIIVAWKDGMVSLSLEKTKDKKLYEETEKSIRVGMGHAMNLLGELHKNEGESFLWAGKRGLETNAFIKTLPSPVAEQNPPPCHQPISWKEPIKECWNLPTSCQHNIHSNNASPGKTTNGILGSCPCDTCTNDVIPG